MLFRCADERRLPVNLEWRRHSGYSLPIDVLLLLQYALLLLLLTLYFVVTHHLLQERPAVRLAFDILLPLFTAAVLGFSTHVSYRDVEDAACVGRSEGRGCGSSAALAHQRLIDPTTRFCLVCSIVVREGTRHCRRCNKCVSGYNHHCRWLNNCIGDKNLRAFYALVSLTCILSTLYLIPTGMAFASYFASSPPFSYLASGIFGTSSSGESAAMGVVSTCFFLQIACTIGLYQLAYVHLRFWLSAKKDSSQISGTSTGGSMAIV